MNFSFKDGVFALDEFGCFVKIEDGVIFQSPMLADGTCEENWCEVENPDPDFLKAIRFCD